MGTKRPHCRRDWDTDLKEIGQRLGFEVLQWDGYPAKGNKALVRCAHKEHWVYPHGQLNKKHCCKVASKTGTNNPSYGIPSWNSGTVGISTGHGIGHALDQSNPTRLDTLYLVTVADVTGKIHYKIGRSFNGPHKRLQRSLVTVIKEWEGPHWLVWTTEQSLLAQNSGSRSCPTPNLANGGGTECFGEGLPITSVISYCNFILGMVDGQKTAYQG